MRHFEISGDWGNGSVKLLEAWFERQEVTGTARGPEDHERFCLDSIDELCKPSGLTVQIGRHLDDQAFWVGTHVGVEEQARTMSETLNRTMEPFINSDPLTRGMMLKVTAFRE